MTAASFHARTGEIIGAFHWVYQGNFAVAWSNLKYTGSITGTYFGPLDYIDGIASAQVGLSVKQFRGITSSLRNRIRDSVKARYAVPSGGTANWDTQRFIDYTKTSSYKSVLFDLQKKNDYGLPVGSVPAELVQGLIPEWAIQYQGGLTYSQDRKDKINNAIKKMGWTWNKTVEVAKMIRRERGVGIGTIFDGMIKWRSSPYNLSISATILKLI